MKAVFVLLALVISACFAQKCTTTIDCGPGNKCVDGNCKVRPECPMYTPPQLKPGCHLETVLDEKGCPKYKQVC
ncbi:unnamed protein product [Cylicocyclus nassatus]|uniref:Uncharacterized protein n=1 Tax=Cylicocyclus nassatus TaxID=53992 RepID=A0AA36M160_CYLNA|nr:unnamed protein product [Cylicocyclus nassatus]